jgi:hypothetical protein
VKFLMKFCIGMLLLHFAAQSVPAQSEEPRLVSPIGAVVRSTVAPGWGQFYIRNYFRGGISVVGIGSSLVGALIAHQAFTDIYNNDYTQAAMINPKSEEALFQYERANQRFKVRQFFLYAAAGIWAYSIIDSYVGANFYNATTKADLLLDDAERIEKLGIRIGAGPDQVHLSLVKVF